MTMPLRPVRVAGGLRLWLATFCMACVSEASVPRADRGLPPRGSPSATALMASVIDRAARATSFARGFAVARPEGLVERDDFFRCRAISLALRDAAAGLQAFA